MHLVIVIPAYNEAKIIGSVIDNLPHRLKHISRITPLVIDDHSTDDTAKVAKEHGATCLRHRINLGAGGAILTGLAAARRLKAGVVVTMDSDGQHDPRDIKHLIQPIIDRQSDVVLGSRLLVKNAKKMPRYKIVGNILLNFVTYVFCGLWVTDSQSGYKALSRKALHSMDLSSSGYEFHSEVVGEIKRLKLRYTEVPITTIYTEYSKSKGQPALNAINIVLGLLMRRVR